jgi:hypothetical protein
MAGHDAARSDGPPPSSPMIISTYHALRQTNQDKHGAILVLTRDKCSMAGYGTRGGWESVGRIPSRRLLGWLGRLRRAAEATGGLVIAGLPIR